jgi:hypothetical protein
MKLAALWWVVAVVNAAAPVYFTAQVVSKSPPQVAVKTSATFVAPDALTAAWGLFNDSISATGWATLDVHTSPAWSDEVQMFAAGFAEGVVTQQVGSRHGAAKGWVGLGEGRGALRSAHAHVIVHVANWWARSQPPPPPPLSPVPTQRSFEYISNAVANVQYDNTPLGAFVTQNLEWMDDQVPPWWAG